MFGTTALPNGFNELNASEEESNQAVMSILDQWSMYDNPQTRVNPNPERPLLRLAHSEVVAKHGLEPNKGRFL